VIYNQPVLNVQLKLFKLL